MKVSFLPSLLAFVLAAAPFPSAWAVDDPGTTTASDELARLSLEELGNIIVTSVSKKPEQLSGAAASIFVITHDDIRRSGATSLPEALRLAPNLEIAQISSSSYTIGARGFNGTSGNKLLVLIDGRSVYTPLFSGVFWDAQDVMLEDIERIEVISGPGGTLWGVNAVNGVINIITRSAKDTQGGMVATGAGNMQDASSARYGGTFGDGGSYRVYAKTFDERNTELADGSTVNDGWHRSQTGFRMDWGQTGDRFSLQGNAYNGAEAQPAPGEIQIDGETIPLGQILISGTNLSADWTHQLEGGGSLNVQSYFDRTSRNVIPVFDDGEDTFDLQILHALAPIGAHSITWGAEYRYGMDNLVNGPYVAFLPAKLNQTWDSLFAQDQWALRDNLQLTAGVRLERNDYTGNEFLPNLRIAWQIDPSDMLWSALSRTVRAPSRLDHDTFVPGVPPYELIGGPNVVSEVARVFELGYRSQIAQNASYSVTLFHTVYDHLRTEQLTPDETAVVFASGMQGSTSGIEAWGNYVVTPTWRLSAGFTALREFVNFYQPSATQFPVLFPGQDPAQTFMLRSSFDLPHQMELDITLRHVGALSDPDVPAYSALGGRLGWTPTKNLELSMTVQNLIGSGHGEFTDVSTRSQIGRSVFFKVVAKF